MKISLNKLNHLVITLFLLIITGCTNEETKIAGPSDKPLDVLNRGATVETSDTVSADTITYMVNAEDVIGTIAVSWDDLADNEDGFVIEKSNDKEGTFIVLSSVGENVVNYSDEEALLNGTNCYRVGAFNQYGTAYSDVNCISGAVDPININNAVSIVDAVNTIDVEDEANAEDITVDSVNTFNTVDAVNTGNAIDAVYMVNAEDITVDSLNTLNTVDIVYATNAVEVIDAVNTANAIDVVDEANAIDAVYMVNAEDITVDSLNTLNTVDTVYAANAVEVIDAVNTGNAIDIVDEANAITYMVNAEDEIGTIAVSWDDLADNEDGFVIEKSNDKEGTFIVLSSVGENVVNYSDEEALLNGTNCYRVGAFNQYGTAYSDVNCISGAVDPININNAVSIVDAVNTIDVEDEANAEDITVDSVNTLNTVDVVNTGNAIDAVDEANAIDAVYMVNAEDIIGTITAWKGDVVDNANEFVIKKSNDDAGEFIVFSSVAENTVNYSDKGVLLNETNCHLAGVFNQNDTAYSDESCIEDVSDTVNIDDTIDMEKTVKVIEISWDDFADNEDGFIIERSASEYGQFILLNYVDADEISYLDKSALLNETNCYRVGAFNQSGTSYSEVNCYYY